MISCILTLTLTQCLICKISHSHESNVYRHRVVDINDCITVYVEVRELRRFT